MSSNSIVVVATEEIVFVRETVQITKENCDILCVHDIIQMSSNQSDFIQNLGSNMTKQNIEKIEKLTQGQCDFGLHFEKAL